MKWVGRAIRRLEDPALVTGRGRFTADLPATHWVRFVRSPVASGRIVRVSAPDGAQIVLAENLEGVRPIRPMLHKFNYQPIEQPVLAKGVVRFVGEPIAAIVAASSAEAEDLAERVDVEIAELPAIVDAEMRCGPTRRWSTTKSRRMSWSKHVRKRPALPMRRRSRTAPCRSDPLAAAECNATRRTRRARSLRSDFGPHHADLLHADAASAAHLYRRCARDCRTRFARGGARRGGGFGQKMSLPNEYVVLVWLARKLRARSPGAKIGARI